MKVIINSPSLDPRVNVSGISSVTQFIISHNKDVEYLHFEVGRKDAESQGIVSRIKRIMRNKMEWKRFLQRNRDSVVHYNIPLMRGAIVRDYMLLKEAHKLGMPIVLHIHGGVYIKERNRPWYIRKLLVEIFSWCKSIIVLGDIEKIILEEDFGLKCVLSLPNCVDLSVAKEFNRSLIKKETLDILYLGRIEPNKGIDYILEAAKLLKTEQVPFTLHFAGKEEREGEYIPKLQSELGESFVYYGVVSGKSKTDLLKKCDVFLLPSFYEGLPMSLIETMSFGMVPVVTDVGSIPTVVTNGENGLFVKVKDVDSIVNKVRTLSMEKGLFQTLSKNAQTTVFSLFDDNEYISSINNLYMK